VPIATSTSIHLGPLVLQLSITNRSRCASESLANITVHAVVVGHGPQELCSCAPPPLLPRSLVASPLCRITSGARLMLCRVAVSEVVRVVCPLCRRRAQRPQPAPPRLRLLCLRLLCIRLLCLWLLCVRLFCHWVIAYPCKHRALWAPRPPRCRLLSRRRGPRGGRAIGPHAAGTR